MNRTLLAFSSVTLALAGGMLAGTATVNAAWARGEHPYAGLDTLARALTTIESHYVEEVGPSELSEAAVRGMAHSLDPHSLYLDADELERLQDRTEGRFLGVGVEIRSHDDGARVTRVLPGGPAALGGVEVGDVLVAIDGEDLAGRGLDTVAERLRGERGTPVTLGLQRGEARLDLALVRDQVISPAATGELFEPGYGYVRIEHFRQRTAAELRQELDRLAREGGRPLDGVVIDLRDNPGGLLEEAQAVVDLFVGDAPVVETRARGGEVQESLRARRQEDDLDARLVVLVDGGSASASEIVAGAMQDLGRATVVGTPTYGKGSVQQVYEFEDGSALKLTVARYYLPGGRTITPGEGLEPDVTVERPDEVDAHVARLQGALDGGGLSQEAAEAARSDLQWLADAASSRPESEIPWEGRLAERVAVDPQLAAAWHLLQPGG